MLVRSLYSYLLMGCLIGFTAAAQSRTAALTTPGPQAMTTGFAGLATNQTARLSVLNLNTDPENTPKPGGCIVQLHFFDIANNAVGKPLVTVIAPQTGTFLDLPRDQANPPGVTDTGRAQIRGVVLVNVEPLGVAAVNGLVNCNVMVTLEIMDANGSTISLTTDTRVLGDILSILEKFPHP